MKIACVWGFAVLATVTPMSVAQSLNIDVGPAGSSTPPISYGGAVGQLGYWNQATGVSGQTTYDLTGAPTAVKVTRTSSSASVNLVALPQYDRELMQSFFWGTYGTGLSVAGLSSSWYDIYVYAWAGFDKNLNACRYIIGESVSGVEFEASTLFSSQWHGQVLGETYNKFSIEVRPGGVIGVAFLFNGGSGETQYPSYINGIQIVQIPAPGVVACVPALLTIAARRRRRPR